MGTHSEIGQGVQDIDWEIVGESEQFGVAAAADDGVCAPY